MEPSNNIAFEVSHVFPVTQATLFNAFIDAATLKQIWGVSSISVDARPGGHARAEMSFDNENWNFTITYQEVNPHDRLPWIFTLTASRVKSRAQLSCSKQWRTRQE